MKRTERATIGPMLEQLLELVTGVKECMNRLDVIEDHFAAFGEQFRKRSRKTALAAARDSRTVTKPKPKAKAASVSILDGRRMNGRFSGGLRHAHPTVKAKATVLRYLKGDEAAVAWVESVPVDQRRRPLPKEQRATKAEVQHAAKVSRNRHSGSYTALKKLIVNLSAEDQKVAMRMYDDNGRPSTFKWIEGKLAERAEGGH